MLTSKSEIEAIIAENQRRRDKLFSPYDPMIGTGSPIPRFEMKITQSSSWYLPEEMRDVPTIKEILDAGSIEELVRQKFHLINQVDAITSVQVTAIVQLILLELSKLRVFYDFEYWAFTCVKLWDKINKRLVPFRLRPAQRKLLYKLEMMRLAGVPIRVILLKARQWGGSTLIQDYMAWIQIFRKTNWHSAIVADVDDQARHIRGMFTRLAKLHPQEVSKITFMPYEGSHKNRLIKERGCIVGIGSVQNPDNLRTYDFAMLHLSEAGLWKSTLMQSAEDLAQTVRASVPSEPYTLIAIESTAKGVGNFFHNEWLNAVEGKSGYTPVFVPWFEIEIYQRDIDDYTKFIETVLKNPKDDYPWFCWEKGATLEGINWYLNFKKTENYDEWRMNSEFPTTPEEAFQSTGRRAFSPIYVQRARKANCDPAWIGDVVGDATKGKDAFRNLHFVKNPQGNLWIWTFPEEVRSDITQPFGGFSDIGGRSQDADYSGLKILNRAPMIEAGVPEVAAVWHGHLDQDLFAWKAAQICYIYRRCLLAIEANSLEKDKAGSEGEHSLTILNEISEVYPNLFARVNPQKVREGVPVMYGFWTDRATKPMLIDGLNGALRDTLYLEFDRRACDEMDWYEVKQDGSYGAVEGKKDDHVIISAGAYWLCTSYMDFPVIIKPQEEKRVKHIGTSSF